MVLLYGFPASSHQYRDLIRHGLQGHTRHIFWGQDDVFFTPAGGEAYLKDLPHAEIHRLAAGHFAVEDNLSFISNQMHRFYAREVAK